MLYENFRERVRVRGVGGSSVMLDWHLGLSIPGEKNVSIRPRNIKPEIRSRAGMKPHRTLLCQCRAIQCNFHSDTTANVCARNNCIEIRGCCTQNWAMLALMDWRPSDQATQCWRVFATYASGRLHCLRMVITSACYCRQRERLEASTMEFMDCVKRNWM